MKVLFLDIDGVVNNEKTTQRHRGVIGIDPFMAFQVGRIVEWTGCIVVLSSSWRHWPDGVKEVECCVCKIADVTGSDAEGVRGREIAVWLTAHKEVERYAILDDSSDMLPEQEPNFFKTSWKEGITEEIANRVIAHLNA